MSKQGDSHGTAENDSTEGGAPRAHKRVTKTSARSTSPGSAGLLIQALGLGSLLAGAAVIALPKALPHQAWIAHSAASHGLSSGVLACGGLILLSIGGALRSLIKRIASASESSNAELLLEQLAGDLAQMRVGVQDLRVELVYAKDSLAGIVEHQHAAEEAAAQAGSQEAIFRLAASLDQVGARLDQRIQHGHATLQRSVAEIQQALQSTHEGLTAAISGARPVDQCRAGLEHESHGQCRDAAPSQRPLDRGGLS